MHRQQQHIFLTTCRMCLRFCLLLSRMQIGKKKSEEARSISMHRLTWVEKMACAVYRNQCLLPRQQKVPRLDVSLDVCSQQLVHYFSHVSQHHARRVNFVELFVTHVVPDNRSHFQLFRPHGLPTYIPVYRHTWPLKTVIGFCSGVASSAVT